MGTLETLGMIGIVIICFCVVVLILVGTAAVVALVISVFRDP